MINYPTLDQTEAYEAIVPFSWQAKSGLDVQTRATSTIYGVFSPDHNYSIQNSWVADKHVNFLENHPFRPEDNEKIVNFVGDPGTTSSIGKFIAEVGGELFAKGYTPHMVLRVYGSPAHMEENLLGYDIIMEVGHGRETWLVGGMNNYSGEGGRGFISLLCVLHHWAALFEKSVEYYFVTEKQIEALEEEIYRMEKEITEENDPN